MTKLTDIPERAVGHTVMVRLELPAVLIDSMRLYRYECRKARMANVNGFDVIRYQRVLSCLLEQIVDLADEDLEKK